MTKTTAKLAHGELTGRIIDGFYDTYAELGHGFSEAVLGRALTITLEEAAMEVARNVPLRVSFRHHEIGLFFADIIMTTIASAPVGGTP